MPNKKRGSIVSPWEKVYHLPFSLSRENIYLLSYFTLLITLDAGRNSSGQPIRRFESIDEAS